MRIRSIYFSSEFRFTEDLNVFPFFFLVGYGFTNLPENGVKQPRSLDLSYAYSFDTVLFHSRDKRKVTSSKLFIF